MLSQLRIRNAGCAGYICQGLFSAENQFPLYDVAEKEQNRVHREFDQQFGDLGKHPASQCSKKRTEEHLKSREAEVFDSGTCGVTPVTEYHTGIDQVIVSGGDDPCENGGYRDIGCRLRDQKLCKHMEQEQIEHTGGYGGQEKTQKYLTENAIDPQGIPQRVEMCLVVIF